jgi:hypothetical protein
MRRPNDEFELVNEGRSGDLTSAAPCRRVVVGEPRTSPSDGRQRHHRHGDPAAKTAVGAEETRSNLAALRRLATVLSPSTVWTWCPVHPLDPARAARSPASRTVGTATAFANRSMPPSPAWRHDGIGSWPPGRVRRGSRPAPARRWQPPERRVGRAVGCLLKQRLGDAPQSRLVVDPCTDRAQNLPTHTDTRTHQTDGAPRNPRSGGITPTGAHQADASVRS